MCTRSAPKVQSYPASNYMNLDLIYYHSFSDKEYIYGIPPMSISGSWQHSHQYPFPDSEFSPREYTDIQSGTTPVPTSYSSFHFSAEAEKQTLCCSSPPPPADSALADRSWEAAEKEACRYVPSISIALDEPPPCNKKRALVDSNNTRPGASLDSITIDSGAGGANKRQRTSKCPSAAPNSTQETSTKVSDTDTQAQSHMYSQFRVKLDPPRPPRNSSRRGVCSSEPPLHDKLRMRIQHLACYFCRRRKIGCVFQDESDPNRTCNQCERRGLQCSFPNESFRGLRYRTRDGRRVTKARAD